MKSLTTTLVAASIATASADSLPPGLDHTRFSGPDITPCPACLCVAPNGDVFAGVDLLGSLGKGPGKGRIVKLVDTDKDGTADQHTVFAEIDNPRGLISLGDKLIVLHTVIPADTGKLTGMHLSVLTDADRDGVADGPAQKLVSDLSPPKHNQDRGADHTTNGIRMGIDGWVYIAVGDFGIVGARGSDGTELTMLGGGVVRVRPDGSGLEVYTHGLRNIYDIAIDPLLNIYTRGNTNDGGGWNIRFIHHIQSGEYGYPVLFKNFTDEIIPALVDVGGGSGTGSLFLSEPTWPDKYNNVPMMCDWGRSQLYIHRITPDGPTFTQTEEKFISVSQITDADVDPSGQLFLGAWDGAGYQGNPGKGYIVRVVPEGWSHRAFPDLSRASSADILAQLRSASASARLAAQQAMLAKPSETLANGAATIALDPSLPVATRVAAIFTYKQLKGTAANPGLLKLTADPTVREHAIRALADHRSQNADLDPAPFIAALQDENPRVQVAAAVALGRIGNKSAATALLDLANPPGNDTSAIENEGPSKFSVTTDTFNGHDTTPVDVDVSKYKFMHLVVTDGGDGSGEDHAAWFNPVFEDADGKQTKLSKLKWRSAKSEWGKNGYGISATGAPLKQGDGTPAPDGLGTHANSLIVYKTPKNAVRFKADVGIASTSRARGKVQFTVSDRVPQASGSKEGPHATPNSPIVLPHVAVRALVDLHAAEACLAAVGTPNSRGALWALKLMHDPKVVDGLIAKYDAVPSADVEAGIISALIRLYTKEAPYDGSWWWGTRPDTRGPYYKPEKWQASEKIATFVKARYDAGDYANLIASQNTKTRANIDGISAVAIAKKTSDEPKVDLGKIMQKQGQVGQLSIEDVILGITDLKSDLKKGKTLFTQQGCIACHTTDSSQPLKGPFMGHVGSILSRDQIAESILKPNASISQGFATAMVTTKKGAAYTGFVSAQTADELELRDIAGQVHKVKTADIATRQELEVSMMPPGLANSLSLQDLANLIGYLESLKQ